MTFSNREKRGICQKQIPPGRQSAATTMSWFVWVVEWFDTCIALEYEFLRFFFYVFFFLFSSVSPMSFTLFCFCFFGSQMSSKMNILIVEGMLWEGKRRCTSLHFILWIAIWRGVGTWIGRKGWIRCGRMYACMIFEGIVKMSEGGFVIMSTLDQNECSRYVEVTRWECSHCIK